MPTPPADPPAIGAVVPAAPATAIDGSEAGRRFEEVEHNRSLHVSNLPYSLDEPRLWRLVSGLAPEGAVRCVSW